MRTLARLIMFVFALLHWFARTLIGAHATVLRNFLPRSRLERGKPVRRD